LSNSKIIIFGIIIVLVLVGGWFAVKSFLAVDNPFYVVSSGSMLPSLERGDGVIIRNGQGFSFNDVVIGDIVVFHSDDDGGRVIIHRVVEIYSDDGQRVLKTKGDANDSSYEVLDYPISEDDYYGKVIFSIPKIAAFRFAGS